MTSATSLTLHGPDTNGLIHRLNPQTNTLTPLFAANIQSSKPQVALSRILPNNLRQPLGTASTSTFSGTTTFSIQNLTIRMEVKNKNLQPLQAFTLPGLAGEWEWRSDKWGTGEDLMDGSGVRVAHAQWYRQPMSVEIFVGVEDWMVEVIVLSALAVMAGDKKGLKIVGKVAGALI